jgi:cystathionine beta-lyase/cystathionine gamma-synthase
VIIIESPTNPLLAVIDIRRVATLARSRGIVTITDNTFATPIHQTPLALGVDVVVHSGTKYLGGHGDLCCGVVVSSRERMEPIRKLARHLGGSLNATTCYLLERSLKTLALRLENQTANALRVANFLADHGAVRQVNYPGLPTCAGHDIARSQMTGFGAMLSFELDGKLDPSVFLRRLQLIRPAVSLGGIETIICAPCATSHAKMSADERKRVGISDGLLRLSVGIEHIDDLLADLSQALS